MRKANGRCGTLALGSALLAGMRRRSPRYSLESLSRLWRSKRYLYPGARGR